MSLQEWATVALAAGTCVGFLALMHRERKAQEEALEQRKAQRQAVSDHLQRVHTLLEDLQADNISLRAENDRLRAELARAGVETRP